VPDSPAPVGEIGHVVDGPAWWSMLEHEPTPELRWPMSVDVYDRMRRQDSQVKSVLRAVTLPVRRTAWRIDPAGARPEVALQVAEDFNLPLVGAQQAPPGRTRDRFSWRDHLRLALLMLPMGHSFFEQVYRIDPNGMARLRKLSQRPSRTINAVNVASDGGLISIEQWGNPDGRKTTPVIPVDRLVAYVNEREGGNWLGESLLRSCYKNWLLKDRLIRVQAQTVERNGMGVPLYKAAENEAELETGRRLAQSWRSGDAAGASVAFGADLVLRGVEGELPDAEPAIRYHDEQIARGVLAHFLNLGTQTGSWALGSTFADFFTLSLQAVAQEVADVVNQHVIEDLVDLNWGEDEPAPKIVFDEIGSQHQLTAEAIKALIEAGALTPDEAVEAQVRNAYSLPPAAPKPEGESPASSRQLSEMSQKLYLAVGELGEKGVLFSTEEGRAILNRAGAGLDDVPIPRRAPAPVTPLPSPPAPDQLELDLNDPEGGDGG
jgi:hypothetical protein